MKSYKLLIVSCAVVLIVVAAVALSTSGFLPPWQSGAFILAVDQHDYGTVQRWVHFYPWLTKKELRLQGTALNIAVDLNDARMATILINAGSDLNFVSPSAGTPLQAAVFYGDAEMVNLLLESGADPNHEGDGMNSSGFPLNRACMEGRYDFVRLLVEHEANVNARDSRGRSGSAIVDAVKFSTKGVDEHRKIISYLFAHGADLSKALPSGMSYRPLVEWAREWQVPEDVIRTLEERGAAAGPSSTRSKTLPKKPPFGLPGFLDFPHFSALPSDRKAVSSTILRYLRSR